MQLPDDNILRPSTQHEAGSFSLITNLDHSATLTSHPQGKEIDTKTASIVIYEAGPVEPRVIRIPFSSPAEYVGTICATVHAQLEAANHSIPYSIIKEMVDNFIHADYCNPVISILFNGRKVVFSDNGPGIQFPQSAIRAGFTTAPAQARKWIRGVGAGFTMVNEYCQSIGARLYIESNLGSGTVVSISRDGINDEVVSNKPQKPLLTINSISQPNPQVSDIPPYALNERQKAVLTVLLNYEDAGPQLVADKLGMGVATAHRDLKTLESLGLAEKLNNRKSKLTELGFKYIDYLASH